MSEPEGRGGAWTEEQRTSEPKGRGVAWTEERGTSDEGRRRVKRPAGERGNKERATREGDALERPAGERETL
jgi:hypothetical protein